MTNFATYIVYTGTNYFGASKNYFTILNSNYPAKINKNRVK